VIFDDKMPDKPPSIVSHNDNMDVAVSEKAKVLFSISASNGNMFTDLDLKRYTPDPKTVEEEKIISQLSVVGLGNIVHNRPILNFREKNRASRLSLQ